MAIDPTEFKVVSNPDPACPLTEALRLTTGPRREAYGHPKDNFRDIARGWEVILKLGPITPEQIALCMIWTKVCRETHRPDFDNEVDIAGYVNTLHMIKEKEKSSGVKPGDIRETHLDDSGRRYYFDGHDRVYIPI